MSTSPQPRIVTELHKAEQPRTAQDLRPRLTVFGVGGAGCNAINNMIVSGLKSVEFVAANTDAQSLAMSKADHRLQLGATLTEGLGAGSKPEIGEAAAEETADEIRARIANSHMVFVAAGMGGGTGTGAAAVIARIARELGILAVGVVTTPFHFEGARRMRVAEAGLDELKKYVDTLIVIPNQNLFRVAHEKTTFAEAFVLADQVLFSGVSCIVDLIMKEGLINLDFADVRTVMSGMGTAVMGTGEAAGERRAVLAAEAAISNPLLDDVSLKGAKGLLLSITGGSAMTLYEVDEAAGRIREEVDGEANIIVGATFDDTLEQKIRVSIVASGMDRPKAAGGENGESLARGKKNAPAQAPADAKAKSPAEPAGAADMQRRLSAALSYDHMSDVFGGSQAPPARGRGGAWRGPGNVVIEERLEGDASEGGYVPGPEDAAPESGMDAPSAPARPARPSRRMPGVEDFPAVGQREYRAKAAPPEGEDEDGPADPDTTNPARKPGLLERLAVRLRG